jgi:hypothetical protein
MRAQIGRLFIPAVAAIFGYAVGWLGAMSRHVQRQPADYPFLSEPVPLPHHIPKYPGGVSFRFAMVSDVLHERFPRHGPAYYRERDRLTREQLGKLDRADPAQFPLLDDVAAGLERLGNSEEAVAVMRDKLARQEAQGLSGRDLYTTYANLGTFLIHASSRKAVAGDPAARAQFREGVEFIRRSVEVNPEAHFGREQWQAAIAEFLLAAMNDPGLLKTFDCVGDRLDRGIPEVLGGAPTATPTGYGRPTDAAFRQEKVAEAFPRFFRRDAAVDDPALWTELSPIRQHITKVGAEAGWADVAVPSHRKPVPFDEPMLGMIGMWRQGAGANPHFALAFGEILLRVGQPDLAWAAFERASRLADRFWPDPDIQQFLRDHCRKRQGQIEETSFLQPPASARPPASPSVSPPPPKATAAELRSKFAAELAHGEGYQRAYQEFEARKIAAGVPISDAHFYDEFQAGRASIASRIGPEEWFDWVPATKTHAYAAGRANAWGVFVAGLTALGAVLSSRWRNARKPTYSAASKAA